MLRWLSGKHRRTASGSTSNSLYRVSLELPTDPLATPCSSNSKAYVGSGSDSSHTSQRSASAAVPDSVPKGKGLASLRRRSLPALHLQEDKSTLVSNPPVFSNPLRRRGCCDHQHTQQMYRYRADAILREQASLQAPLHVPLEAA